MGAQIVVSIGASDLELARQFYEGALGLTVDRASGPFVGFETEDGSSGLALYSGDPLAFESGLVEAFRGVAFSYIVQSPEDVDKLMASAEAAGGQIQQPAARAEWGGYIGYLTDPDGNLLKVVANPR